MLRFVFFLVNALFSDFFFPLSKSHLALSANDPHLSPLKLTHAHCNCSEERVVMLPLIPVSWKLFQKAGYLTYPGRFKGKLVDILHFPFRNRRLSSVYVSHLKFEVSICRCQFLFSSIVFFFFFYSLK